MQDFSCAKRKILAMCSSANSQERKQYLILLPDASGGPVFHIGAREIQPH